MQINDKLLCQYISLDREIKEKEKIRESLKKSITAFLHERAGKSLITRNCIAHFNEQFRTVYNIPDELKNEYAEKKQYKILKVEEKSV